MVNVSAECRALYRLRYQPIVGRYIDQHSADVSIDISVDMSTCISRPIYRPSDSRYVDRHLGRVSVDKSTDTSVDRKERKSDHRSKFLHFHLQPQNKYELFHVYFTSEILFSHFMKPEIGSSPMGSLICTNFTFTLPYKVHSPCDLITMIFL